MTDHDTHEAPPPFSSHGPRPIHLMILDQEPQTRTFIDHALPTNQWQIYQADSVESARDIIANSPIDIVLLDTQLPEGNGLELAQELHLRHPAIQTIMMSHLDDAQIAINALRAGACDLLTKPLDLQELNQCVRKAISEHAYHERMEQRIDRLKRLCKNLNRARCEVTQQVDILCNDLVTAYQELADQMKSVEQTTRFRTLIEQNLDAESLMRTLLEQLLHLVGPTNAVVFAPGEYGQFNVNGYINYSCDPKTVEILLQYLATHAAPAAAELDQSALMTSSNQIQHWLDDTESHWLDHQHVLAIPCSHQGPEPLAIILLFRHENQPFAPDVLSSIQSITQLFAEHLHKVISVSHRHTTDPDDSDAPDLID